jgi:hypothetical protein
MKKLSYKQTDVKKVNWSKTEEQTRGQEIVFSVDVAKNANVGLLISKEGEVIKLIWQFFYSLVASLLVKLGRASK